jgi:hypothetical protein
MPSSIKSHPIRTNLRGPLATRSPLLPTPPHPAAAAAMHPLLGVLALALVATHLSCARPRRPGRTRDTDGDAGAGPGPPAKRRRVLRGGAAAGGGEAAGGGVDGAENVDGLLLEEGMHAAAPGSAGRTAGVREGSALGRTGLPNSHAVAAENAFTYSQTSPSASESAAPLGHYGDRGTQASARSTTSCDAAAIGNAFAHSESSGSRYSSEEVLSGPANSGTDAHHGSVSSAASLPAGSSSGRESIADPCGGSGGSGGGSPAARSDGDSESGDALLAELTGPWRELLAGFVADFGSLSGDLQMSVVARLYQLGARGAARVLWGRMCSAGGDGLEEMMRAREAAPLCTLFCAGTVAAAADGEFKTSSDRSCSRSNDDESESASEDE